MAFSNCLKIQSNLKNSGPQSQVNKIEIISLTESGHSEARVAVELEVLNFIMPSNLFL
jgi:hypothetical protein